MPDFSLAMATFFWFSNCVGCVIDGVGPDAGSSNCCGSSNGLRAEYVTSALA